MGLSLGLLALNTALLVGLAAGPDALAPMVAAESVSPERAVVGTLYEHLAGLTGGFALAAIAVALVLSRRMPRIGMVVAVLATVINVASPFVGAVVGLVRSGRG